MVTWISECQCSEQGCGGGITPWDLSVIISGKSPKVSSFEYYLRYSNHIYFNSKLQKCCPCTESIPLGSNWDCTCWWPFQHFSTTCNKPEMPPPSLASLTSEAVLAVWHSKLSAEPLSSQVPVDVVQSVLERCAHMLSICTHLAPGQWLFIIAVFSPPEWMMLIISFQERSSYSQPCEAVYEASRV